MKKFTTILLVSILFAACAENEADVRRRAAELCKYVPDHALSEEAADFMTPDFHAVLDTMFNLLPELGTIDNEWLYQFVTGNGGTIPDYEVTGVEKTDATHAVATVLVRQKWDDGSFVADSDAEEHELYMEKVDGKWLMSDFDGHKEDCIKCIGLSWREQALRDAISDYLVKEIGPSYLQGELCVPSFQIVAEEEESSEKTLVWCDTWVFWYNADGDTLKIVSGGNHSGCMTLLLQDGRPVVTDFEQTVDGAGNDASARRIFGTHYEIFRDIHSNDDLREAVRKEQLSEYLKRNG